MTSEQHRPLLDCPLDEIIKVYENNHINPPWSYLLVFGLDAIAFIAIAWCVLEIVEARRAARQAKRIEESNLPLHEGARFVAGNVELGDGTNLAIRVTLSQEGTQRAYKNGHTHTWTEVDRQIEAVPFYLRITNGDRIRVEPPVDVMLVDRLDQMEWLAPAFRRRRAELTPGERAVVEGRLEHAVDPELHGPNATYRTVASKGWVMKPTKRRGMYVSTESLSRRHELRARAFSRAMLFAMVINVIAASVLFQYRTSLVLGHNVGAHYGGKKHYQTHDSKGRVIQHYAAIVSYMDDPVHVFSEQIDLDYNDFVKLPQNNSRIWLRYVPGRNWATTLGVGASVNAPLLIISAILVGIGFYRIIRAKLHRRWYEGQVVEQAHGPLPVPMNIRFVADEVALSSKTKPLVAPAVDRITVDFTTETKT